jgi:hypothetical protein
MYTHFFPYFRATTSLIQSLTISSVVDALIGKVFVKGSVAREGERTKKQNGWPALSPWDSSSWASSSWSAVRTVIWNIHSNFTLYNSFCAQYRFHVKNNIKKRQNVERNEFTLRPGEWYEPHVIRKWLSVYFKCQLMQAGGKGKCCGVFNVS